ncbi:RcnB family protein [Mangrovibacter plantisponsor]|uniref:Nickel/cobalt transporter regulator n=1 Tax=Mangrovibacter plantisponsor TaxID=451513 RepID=A0A317PZA1_9ENTR|nr:RcnB family protein [Mangrovibacter plantisponsor]PWW07817.1 nickel/cobalt transporter regulator [Mangrovibacter plantisponsor]
MKYSHFLLLLLTILPGSVYALSERSNSQNSEKYRVNEFMADFTRYHPGDMAPALYLTKPYIITAWKVRNLPVPGAENHWTYMGETYVLLDNKTGRIIKAYQHDIFYPQS